MRVSASAPSARTAMLADLRRLFTGVHGRLVDVCEPTQPRYKIAVTVAMQAHLDSIVVDTQASAMQCISYLKENRLGSHTFLPLDSLSDQAAQRDAAPVWWARASRST
jgi:structural maintenance of chromosome 1